MEVLYEFDNSRNDSVRLNKDSHAAKLKHVENSIFIDDTVDNPLREAWRRHMK